ncbi:AGAP013252-PA-like protein [Anopheles sinensis]|uniref:AGAP013252-PA-like protein n=1 Tax=Anopheles sinensis TaxID=74873 RepID=A0A084WAW2_ANOSI|nr:AGAP013252-PA-like protein [Anopheles sinensis]
MAGDSGRGLVFKSDGRWFTRAMVLVKSLSSIRSPNISDYTAFTDAASYRGCEVKFVDTDTDVVLDNSKMELLNLETCGIFTNAGGRHREHGHPWIGLVEMRLISTTVVRCVVTLINEWYAVGPARCFDINLSRLTTERLTIETIIVHPQYNRDTFTNNLALIEFRQAANITRPDITPICLPITEDLRSYQSSSLVAASFERDKKRVVVKATSVVNNADCQTQYLRHTAKYELIVDKAQFCTNLLNRASDECMSGAPIVTLQKFNERRRYFLRGLFNMMKL